MKKKLACILLVLCMIVSLFPVSALATQEEAELYVQMLQLGLVDENGDLIEDNTFTVEDGTWLGSLDALVQWLNDSDESEHGLLITVDRTGRSATAAQMAQALALEYDMADVVSQARLLASGDGTSRQGTPAKGQTVEHIEVNAVDGVGTNTDTMGWTFTLVDSLWEVVTDFGEVTLEVGLFSSLLDNCSDISVSGKENTPGINTYTSFTVEADGTVTVWFDMATIRTVLDNTGNVWSGSQPLVLQARIVDGAPACTAREQLNVEPSAYWEKSNLTLYDLATHAAMIINTGGANYTVYTAKDLSHTEETVDSVSVYKTTIPEFKAEINDATTFDSDTRKWNNKEVTVGYKPMYSPILEAGLGDDKNDPHVQITMFKVTFSEDMVSAPDLYYKENGKLEPLNTGKTLQDNKKTVEYTLEWPFTLSGDHVCFDIYVKKDAGAYPESILCAGGVYLADTKAPTITDVSIPVGRDFWLPGDTIPITVTFSEPVMGNYKLAYQNGADIDFLDSVDVFYGDGEVEQICAEVYGSERLMSKTRTFLYTVQDTDSGDFLVKGVGPADDNATDVFENALKTNASSGGQSYAEYTKRFENILDGGTAEYSINSISASMDDKDPYYTVNVTVGLKDGFAQEWSSWAEEETYSAAVVLDGIESEQYALEYTNEGNLACTIDLSQSGLLEDGTHVAEIYLGGKLYYGSYTTFTPETVTPVKDGDYTIAITQSEWPSGKDRVIYKLDKTVPTFTASKTGTGTYTFEDEDQFYWTVSEEGTSVFEIKTDDETKEPNLNSTVSVIAKGAGKAYLQLMAKNGTSNPLKHTVAAKLEIEVLDGGQPGLVIPENANTFFTRMGEDVKVSFSANLNNDNKVSSDDGTITAELYEGSTASGTPFKTWTVERSASSVTVPGEYLTILSKGTTAAYTLKLSAKAMKAGTETDYSATAYIIVRAQPTKIAIDMGSAVLAGESITVPWTLTNFDPEGTGQFQLLVQRNGEEIAIATDPGTETGENVYTGSLSFTPVAFDGLKDYYVITAKAKADIDATWSTAAVTLTVYQNDALDLLVDGESVDSVTLKNTVEGGTTNNPSITKVSGDVADGLTNAEAIAQLRSELGLIESIQVDTSNGEWGMRDDKIRWSTSTGEGAEIADEFSRAVTINYRSGLLYEPLEKFTYTSYIPQAVMVLCGMRDGTNIVTASHNKIDGLSDSVTVNVERLKDQLYLFQFTPAAETTLYYEDSKGVSHTVTSNADGSLALFEPDGIASELRLVSEDDEGVTYRGTVTALTLKSGEGNGAQGELYPLNAIELRRAAVAEIQLFKPDGTALANTNVTLRGGVYRNAILADERDDAYCTDAKFGKEAKGDINMDGKQDMTFKTDSKGVLTVYMDLMKFTSKNDPDPVGVGDSLQFIFELTFAGDKYYPELVIVDSSLTKRDALRSGADQITLQEADGKQPFAAVQTVDYYTGREMDVRYHTGVVGPSSNYSEAMLDTTVMLWGVALDAADGYSVSLRSQKNAIAAPKQSVIAAKYATYPFSSIPLVKNETPLNSNTFKNYEAAKKTAMEAALSKDGTLLRTISLPFGLVDMTALEKVEEAKSLTSLMANLQIYGQMGANTGYDLSDELSNGILVDALSGLTEMGSEIGLVRSVLLPTEDPTRFDGYFWTGLNTTKLDDLDYDENNITLELSYFGKDWDCDNVLGQVNDTFTFSDFQAMADGSYFDDVSGIYGDVSSFIGSPVMLQLEGWMTCEIRYNFDKGQWEVVTTGGGFTAGGQLEFEESYDLTILPLTFSIKVSGGVVIDFQAAMRYAEQVGYEWDDDAAKTVNDYLTALRINGYVEAFGGVGRDEGVTGKIGIFGSLNLDNENRFLTRNYLANEDDRDVYGQYLELTGELGVRAAAGVGSVATEVTVFSVSGTGRVKFNDWDEIDEYWENTSSGLGGTGTLDPGSGENSIDLASLLGLNAPIFVESNASVHLQDRDYLSNGRTWNEGGMMMLTGAEDESSPGEPVEKNAYPYSMPQVSDDGSMWIYVSDQKSDSVEDARIYWGGIYTEGYAMPDPADGFTGYGDSSPDLDGTGSFAGAVWLREAETVNKMAGTEINEAEQSLLLNSLEVVASIFDGNDWTTTRLTTNGSQEIQPVIAVNENGQAIVAWRSVQTEDGLFDYDQEQILCRIYDGSTWSEDTYTLYNGADGSVSGLAAEMLPDGTAAIAYSLEKTGNVFYVVMDVDAEKPEDNAKTIQAYGGKADSPALETVKIDGKDMFVLGWHSTETTTKGITTHDVGLLAFDNTGAPLVNMPESLSQVVSTDNYGGTFTFAKGATNLDDLAIVWVDSGAGENDADILRAAKFCSFGAEGYGLSAATDAVTMDEYTTVDSFDACCNLATGGLMLALQATTYDPKNPETVRIDGSVKTASGDVIDCTGTGTVYPETTNLYSASASFQNAVSVDSITVDFSTLATEANIPVNFAVTNNGMDILNTLTVTIDGSAQTFSNLNLRPGQTTVVSPIYKTGTTIENKDYTITASFQSGNSPTASGTVYLDYPDVGISKLQVTQEQEGKRSLLVTLYNQSAAEISSGDRRVVLGVYSDSSCDAKSAIDGKYFKDGTNGKSFETIIYDDKDLAALDGAGLAKEIVFDMATYIEDAKLKEIPDGGVTLFVKARIEEKNADGEWITLPEADAVNNQEYITLESLLERSDGEPVTTTVQLENGENTSSAKIQVRNNSLQGRSAGKLTVTLVDAKGKVLESTQCNVKKLAGEDVVTENINFKSAGSQVVVRYADTSGDDNNATASSITLDGLNLSMSDFDSENKAQIKGVKRGTYLLTVIPEAADATVTVNGNTAENGVLAVTTGSGDTVLNIVITAPDGTTASTYVVQLSAPEGGGAGGGGAATTPTTSHTIKATAGENGTISPAGSTSVGDGESKRFTITPNAGYAVSDVKVDGSSVGAVTSYTFQNVEADHTIEATFTEAEAGTFVDVPAGSYYEDAVDWAVENGVTTGSDATHFSPDGVCTRAQAVTFLWRAAGSPEPTTETMPFTDVKSGSYYYDAVLWAVENGITKGTSDTEFSPNQNCSRGQIVTFLYRSEQLKGNGMQGAWSFKNPFTDVDTASYYGEAVMWAVANSITTGTSDTTFSPNANCTRAQIVTFIWRTLAK